MKHGLIGFCVAMMLCVSGAAHAQLGEGVVADLSVVPYIKTSSGTFTKKRYSIHGEWNITSVDGKTVLRFSDNFKTKNGPDLKVFLSPKNMGDLTGKTALDGALNLSVLQSNKNEQSYTIPDTVDLTQYESVIIHCEAYSVLWGGFDIPK